MTFFTESGMGIEKVSLQDRYKAFLRAYKIQDNATHYQMFLQTEQKCRAQMLENGSRKLTKAKNSAQGDAFNLQDELF